MESQADEPDITGHASADGPAPPQDPVPPDDPPADDPVPRYDVTGYGIAPLGSQPGAAATTVRPGRIWYLAALAVLLAGVAWIVVGLLSVNNQTNGFARVPLPGGGQVTLAHSGGYLVYFEANGASSTAPIPTFHVRIVPAAAPAAMNSLQPYTGSVSYSIGPHQGRAVLSLRVTHPGRFLVQPSGVPAIPGGADLAIGPSIAGAAVAALVPSFALFFIGLGGAIAINIARRRGLRGRR